MEEGERRVSGGEVRPPTPSTGTGGRGGREEGGGGWLKSMSSSAVECLVPGGREGRGVVWMYEGLQDITQ